VISIIGAGAMGTALAIQLAKAGKDVTILATAFDGAFVDAMRRGEPHPGLGIPAPDGMEVRDHEAWAAELAKSDALVLAVSTAGVAPTVRAAAHHARPEALWIVATKGWEDETLRSAARVVADELGDPKRVITLVGPSLAGEIAAGVPTAVVCASLSEDSARRAADLFSAPLFKTYTSDDVAGVEVGAALKNVIAIAVGMCDGVSESFGVDALTNTKAFLFSRGLVEMARLALAQGGRAETVLGLAGAGDLFVTCLGGRNARFGKLVGAGKAPERAIEEMRTTVEGYTNARAAEALAKRHGLDLPIVRSVVEVLFGSLSPREAIERLVAGTVEEEFNP
jgi:glycerol-3-phosphate dehydrogenase (NAD(P)+)